MLDANNNIYSLDTFEFEFHKVSNLILRSYDEIIKNEQIKYTKIKEKYWVVLENGKEKPEEYIRNIFLDRKYMLNKKLKREFEISDLEFKSEVGEQKYRRTTGFHDIQVIGIAQKLFDEADEDIYFSIECKRLNGAGQNSRKYVNEGIKRYTTNKYSEKMSIAGMIGFIEDNCLNYSDGIDNILKKHKTIETKQYLLPYKKLENKYTSKHTKYKSNDIILIYHFLLNFETIITKKKE